MQKILRVDNMVQFGNSELKKIMKLHLTVFMPGVNGTFHPGLALSCVRNIIGYFTQNWVGFIMDQLMQKGAGFGMKNLVGCGREMIYGPIFGKITRVGGFTIME